MILVDEWERQRFNYRERGSILLLDVAVDVSRGEWGEVRIGTKVFGGA